MALLATLRLAGGIATFHLGGTDIPPVTLPSVASLADGSDSTGGYSEASGDGVTPFTAEWGADGELEVLAGNPTIDRVEIVLRASRETTLGVAGSGTIRAAVDEVLLGAGGTLGASAAAFTFDAPGSWTAASLGAARFGWRLDVTTGDEFSAERGHVVDYLVNIYGTEEDVRERRTATLRAGTREA